MTLTYSGDQCLNKMFHLFCLLADELQDAHGGRSGMLVASLNLGLHRHQFTRPDEHLVMLCDVDVGRFSVWIIADLNEHYYSQSSEDVSASWTWRIILYEYV